MLQSQLRLRAGMQGEPRDRGLRRGSSGSIGLMPGGRDGAVETDHGPAIVDAEVGASGLDAQAQVTVLGEVADADDGGGKTRGGTDAERPARSEPVGYPADDRRADRGAAQGDRETDRQYTSPHRRLGG